MKEKIMKEKMMKTKTQIEQEKLANAKVKTVKVEKLFPGYYMKDRGYVVGSLMPYNVFRNGSKENIGMFVRYRKNGTPMRAFFPKDSDVEILDIPVIHRRFNFGK